MAARVKNFEALLAYYQRRHETGLSKWNGNFLIKGEVVEITTVQSSGLWYNLTVKRDGVTVLEKRINAVNLAHSIEKSIKDIL